MNRLTFNERTEGAWATLCSNGTRDDAAIDFDLPFFYIDTMITARDVLLKHHVLPSDYSWKDAERMVVTMISTLMVSSSSFS